MEIMIADHVKSWKNHGIVFLNFCGNPVIRLHATKLIALAIRPNNTNIYLSLKTCSGRSIGPGLRGSFKPPFETKLFHFHGEFSGKMYGLLVRIKLCFLDPYNIFVWVSVLA